MIRITVSGRHMELNDDLKSYASQKAGKLEKYYDRIQSVDVVFDRRSGIHHCEIIAKADHHVKFIAKEAHDDPFATLDASVKNLERQVTRHKEKFRNRKHPDGLSEKEPLTSPANDDFEASPTEGEGS